MNNVRLWFTSSRWRSRPLEVRRVSSCRAKTGPHYM